MTAARKACHVSTWRLWLSPYRWHVELHDGSWNVRVPSFNGALNCAYSDVTIRAADGVAGRCDTCFPDTVVIAAAK